MNEYSTVAHNAYGRNYQKPMHMRIMHYQDASWLAVK